MSNNNDPQIYVAETIALFEKQIKNKRYTIKNNKRLRHFFYQDGCCLMEKKNYDFTC